MDIRPLSPAYAVSPQIDPEDMAAIAAAGFRVVINNRPDMEIPPSHQTDVMEAAARAAGLQIITLPVNHATLNAQTVATQKQVISEADGPVLAYCASGTRCTIVWALGQAGDMATDDIITAAAAAGYDLAGMRSQLDALAQG